MGFVSFDRPGRRPGEAVLRFAVAALTSLLVVALAGLTVVEVRPSWLAGLRNAVPAPAPAATSPLSTAPRHGLGHAPAASGRHAPVDTEAAAKAHPGAHTAASAGAGGHGPRLVGLHPATGGPGQHVSISGDNLFSANGRITLRFGDQAAPVRCTSTRRCIATVPHLGGAPRTTQVSLRTTGGISNALAFHYR